MSRTRVKYLLDESVKLPLEATAGYAEAEAKCKGGVGWDEGMRLKCRGRVFFQEPEFFGNQWRPGDWILNCTKEPWLMIEYLLLHKKLPQYLVAAKFLWFRNSESHLARLGSYGPAFHQVVFKVVATISPKHLISTRGSTSNGCPLTFLTPANRINLHTQNGTTSTEFL